MTHHHGDGPPVEELIPQRPTLSSLARVAGGCTACHLHRGATQTVFGEGPRSARLVLVGEQPGDKEDVAGRPFVGPAGQLLDRALEAAGIERDDVYVTNVVKHFKWTPKGKRRIHAKPDTWEVAACRPWLDAELTVVRPRVVVALGATAAQALLGRGYKVTQERGTFRDWPPDALITSTLHPSAILRGDDREAMFAGVVDDLRKVATALS